MTARATKLMRELFRHEQWNIGIIDRPIHALLKCDGSELPPVRWFPDAPRGEFLADPFGVWRDGKLYIFYEHFDYDSYTGRLVALATDRDFTSWNRYDVLPQDVHASYPYLFEHDRQLYCIPETHQARATKLYRCKRLPGEWELVATLLEGFGAIDPTIVRFDDRWWLFAVDGDRGVSDRLNIWHADELAGPWHEHRHNPVKIDVASARPGGTPFVHDRQLYRPAQDCTHTYGGRTLIMRVTKLTPDDFEEEKAVSIVPQPDWPFPGGLHTISAAGDVTLIDAKRYLFTFGGFSQKMTTIAGKLVKRPS